MKSIKHLLKVALFVLLTIRLQAQEALSHVISENYKDFLYSKLPNDIYFFVAPNSKSQKDSFEIKSSQCVIQKKISNQYIITPLIDSGDLKIEIYKNGKYFDYKYFGIIHPPEPYISNYPPLLE